MAQMLVQSGAAFEARDSEGKTPLAWASSDGGLAGGGASVRVERAGFSQPSRVPLLMLMLTAVQSKVFRRLLDSGADLTHGPLGVKGGAGGCGGRHFLICRSLARALDDAHEND